MKSIVLILALIAVSQASNIQGSILTFNGNGAMKTSPKADSYNFNDLISLYKHSMGLPQEIAQLDTQKFINEYQRGNMMNPSYMNYLIMFEGAEENRDQIVSKQKKIDFQLSEESDNQSILNQIYDTKDKSSLAAGISQQFLSQSQVPVYFFSLKAQNNKYFKNFGVSIKQNKDLTLSIFQIQKPYNGQHSFSIDQCLSQGLNGQFYYDQTQNVLGKVNTDLKIQITEQNINQVSLLLEEVCGGLKISSSFNKGDKPNFITFHFTSIEEMNKVSNVLEQSLVKELWKSALTQIVSNFDSQFKNSVLGTVIFVDSSIFREQILKDTSMEILPRNIQFSQLNKANTLSQRRALQVDPTDSYNPNYQIRIWFSVFFIVLIYFTLYALFTAQSDRDSLLYAKFLTTDVKN